jgi:hypothetical protein
MQMVHRASSPGPGGSSAPQGDRAGTIADRIAGALSVLGQHCARLSDKSPLEDEDAWRADSRPGMVVVADGPRWRAAPPCGSWDAVIDARMVVEAPC